MVQVVGEWQRQARRKITGDVDKKKKKLAMNTAEASKVLTSPRGIWRLYSQNSWGVGGERESKPHSYDSWTIRNTRGVGNVLSYSTGHQELRRSGGVEKAVSDSLRLHEVLHFPPALQIRSFLDSLKNHPQWIYSKGTEVIQKKTQKLP